MSVNRKWGENALVACALFLFVGIGSVVWLAMRPGVYSKMLVVLSVNPWFYAFACLGALVPVVQHMRQRQALEARGGTLRVTLQEVGAHIVAGTLFLHLVCVIVFFLYTDLSDTEIWNGYVTEVTYQEVYDTETCTESCDADGDNCTTTCTCDSHGPYWTIGTNNDEAIRTSSQAYQRYTSMFGNETNIGSAGDQCAGSRGYTWQTTYTGPASSGVPTAHGHPYVNFLRASKAFQRDNPAPQALIDRLPDYPSITGSDLGPIAFDRVLPGKVPLPAGWASTVDGLLDTALIDLGTSHQVNVIVVLTTHDDPAFAEALDFHWRHGKKNDVIVILGAPEFPRLAWVETLAWTRDATFPDALTEDLTGLGTLDDPIAFAERIIRRIRRPASEGGFERQPMAELAHLAADVEISAPALLLIFVLYGLVTTVLAVFFAHNETYLQFHGRMTGDGDAKAPAPPSDVT